MNHLPASYVLVLGFTAGFLACVLVWLAVEWRASRRNAREITIAPAVLAEARRVTLPYRAPVQPLRTADLDS